MVTDAIDRKAKKLKRPSKSREAKARRLRAEAGELDARGRRIKSMIATLEAEALMLFVQAEAMRRKAEEL